MNKRKARDKRGYVTEFNYNVRNLLQQTILPTGGVVTVAYDDNGNVGKRYRRQDEIGTPWCIVIDFDTIGSGDNINPDFKDMVTIRDRDTGEQTRVAINELVAYIASRI